MRQQIHKKTMEIVKAVCLFVFSALFSAGVNAQTTSYVKAESFLFSFREANDMFLADYGDNAYWLQRMNESLQASRVHLLEGNSHLLIVAHVSAYDYEDESVINEAALRASRIRAYIKSKLNIPHECVAFYIDRSGSYRDQVHVYRVQMPLPWFANQEISCSESRYPNAVTNAIARYGSVPYVDLYRRSSTDSYEREVYVITDPLFDRSELEDYRLAVSDGKPDIQTKQTMPVAHEKQSEEYIDPEEPAVVQTTRLHFAASTTPRLLAVKTNLLPWATVAPAIDLGSGGTEIQTGSFMPNLELEYYFARRWSLAFSVLYADFSYGGGKENKWGLSDVMLASRFWPLGEADRYNWLSVGFYGMYGDFDVRGDKIGGEGLYGRTGRFWSAGLSVGCLVPLGAGFAVETVAEGGYRSVFGGKKYRYDGIDGKNYLESRFTSTGVRLGVKLNLLYRFRIR